MKEVYNDVELEPQLLPLTGETLRHRTANTDSDARADIRVRGSGLIVVMRSLIQGYFIPTHQAIAPGACHLCIENSRPTKRENTVSELTHRLNMYHLLLWSFQLVVEWDVKLQW